MKRHNITILEYELRDMEVWTILGPFHLNPVLATQQQISPDDLDRIKVLHQHMAICKFQASKFAAANNRILAREYAEKVDRMDADLQKAWRFPPDPGYRYHWCCIPGCKCHHSLVMKLRIVDPNCVFHGAPV